MHVTPGWGIAELEEGSFRMLTTTLVATYEPPGETWPEVLAWMADDPDDAEVVQRLVHELRAAGSFERPVVVDPVGREVVNGRHRVVAALVAGHPVLDVALVAPECEVLDVEVELATRPSAPAAWDDACGWSLWGALRSFPLEGPAAGHWAGRWVEADVMSAGPDGCHLVYQLPPGSTTAVATAMARRLDLRGLPFDVVGAWLLVDGERVAPLPVA